MIRIISGTCRTEQGLKNSSDLPFSLTKEVEERLVNRKVAVYVTATVVATPPAGQEEPGTGVNSTGDETGTQGNDEGAKGEPPIAKIVDGHFVKEDLMKLTRPELDKLAADLGIENPEECANKGVVADLIAAIDLDDGEGNDEGNGMPNLSPEDPVQ